MKRAMSTIGRPALGNPGRFAGLRVLLLCLLFAPTTRAGSQEKQEDPKRTQALELYRKHQCLDALPLFQDLAAADPGDALVQEGLGVCLLSHAATLPTPEERQAGVKRSRQALVRAKELGDSSDIVRVLLEITPEDGKLPAFSGRGDAESAMRQGEAAFARRDLDGALAAYQQAMLLDPKLYEAPLFVGDCYFAKGDYGQAEAWFAVAVSVDENKETAYRYWGDALLAQGKRNEAHAKYIEAVIVEPYSQRTWGGLGHWAQATGRKLSQPNIGPPDTISSDPGNRTITVDAGALTKGDGSSAWLAYEISRAAWKKRYASGLPGEKEYRHSLAEESEALNGVVAAVRALPEKEKAALQPGLKTLLDLSERGLLEAYIVFARADEGIAQDYVPYRTQHRTELRSYLRDYVGVEPQ